MTTGTDKVGWSTLMLIAGIAALVAIIYSPSFATMLELWQRSDHHHGLLVFPIVGYLLWRGRASLAAARLQPWAAGLLILVALVCMWLLSRAVGVQASEHLAVVLMIPAAVATFLGLDLLRRALFPLLFIAAAVPVADSLVPMLMRITADISETLLNAAGVPVYREGQFMTLPGGRFEIADVCSGLRYLISGTIIALLFGYLTYRSHLKRALLAVLSGAVLVVANGVRAFIVMYVASATDLRYLVGHDHVYFGWLLFGVVMVSLLWVGARYADAPELQSAEHNGGNVERAPSNLVPMILVLGCLMLLATAWPFEAVFGNIGLLLLFAASAVLMVLTLYWRFAQASSSVATGWRRPRVAYRSLRAAAVICLGSAVLIVGPLRFAEPAEATAPKGARLALPGIPVCGQPAEWALDWQPTFERPDFSGSAAYACDGALVHAFVAGYSVNLQGRELVNEANHLVPVEWRRYVERRNYRTSFESGGPTEVVEVRVERPSGGSLIWYWYSVGDRTALNPLSVKLLQTYNQIVRGRSEGEVYLLETELDADVESSRRRLAIAAAELSAAQHSARSAPPMAGAKMDP